jgi:repressor LexA
MRWPAITDRQREILRFVADRIASGLPPTNKEIRARFGFRSSNAVADFYRALERKGYIQRDPMLARAVRITTKARRELGISRIHADSTGAEVCP